MYIGSTGERGLHHLVWEVVDNSVDEALAGYCDRIVLTLLADGGVRVEDNGRGIPTDTHPGEGCPALTLALTVLHAGGKFGGGGYKVSGGLHGVGISVVNALSSPPGRRGPQPRPPVAPVVRRTACPTATLEQVRRLEPGERTGTTITYWASDDIFETTTYSFETITTRFREMAFLNKGLEIVVRDERPDGRRASPRPSRTAPSTTRSTRPGADAHPATARAAASSRSSSTTAAWSTTSSTSTGARTRPTRRVISFEAETVDAPTAHMSLEVAMQWNTTFTESVHTFANTINTHEGGTHEEGFRAALTSLVNDWGEEWGLMKKQRGPGLAATTSARA